jgi:hypothetical protein
VLLCGSLTSRMFLSTPLFQGCRPGIGCHSSEGIWGRWFYDVLFWVLGLDPMTRGWIFVVITSWSVRPAEGESAALNSSPPRGRRPISVSKFGLVF